MGAEAQRAEFGKKTRNFETWDSIAVSVYKEKKNQCQIHIFIIMFALKEAF